MHAVAIDLEPVRSLRALMTHPINREDLDRKLKSFLDDEPQNREAIKHGFSAILGRLDETDKRTDARFAELHQDIRGVSARVSLLEAHEDETHGETWRAGAQSHQRIHPPAPAPYRTAPGSELVVAAAHSIPPAEVSKLGKASKSGSWRFDPDMILEAMGDMREKIDRQQDEIKGLDAARQQELELKAAAEEARIAVELEAKQKEEAADRKNARLRGWLALALTALAILGTTFAYLAPRLGQEHPPVTAPAR